MKKILPLFLIMATIVAGCGSKKKVKEEQPTQKETVSRHFIESENDNKENYTDAV